MGDDQSLDQELRQIFCEERLDPVDVVEGKSTGSGHSSDVVAQRLLVVPEFNFSKIEFEVMCSCPSRDVCQILPDACCNMGVGGERGKER